MKGDPVYIVLLSVGLVAAKDVFKCHGDLCNIGNEPQFCSDTFEICRDCKDIKDACGTATQPRNCTRYCQDLAVNRALLEKAKELEDSCLILPMLSNLDHGNVLSSYNGSRIPVGSFLQYTCSAGYHLEGTDTNTCLGNETWSHGSLPYCLDKSWIEFRHAAIVLGIACGLLLVIIIYCGIALRRSGKERDDKNMSRTSTNSSIKSEKGINVPLLPESQTMNNEEETSRLTMRSASEFKSVDVATQTTDTSTTPPSRQEKNDNEKSEKSDRKRSDYQDPTAGPSIIINNNLMINNTNNASQQNNGNDKTDNEETNVPNTDVPPRQFKSIDMKMSTEVSDDNDRLDRGTNSNSHGDIDADEERPREKKRQGTKPLPARAIVDEKAKDKEPQVVTTEEDGQSPTKESDPDNASANIGINGVTFAKSDINGDGKQKEVELDGSIASVTLESEQDEPLAKVGFGNVTYQTTDIKMDELKSGY